MDNLYYVGRIVDLDGEKEAWQYGPFTDQAKRDLFARRLFILDAEIGGTFFKLNLFEGAPEFGLFNDVELDKENHGILRGAQVRISGDSNSVYTIQFIKDLKGKLYALRREFTENIIIVHRSEITLLVN